MNSAVRGIAALAVVGSMIGGVASATAQDPVVIGYSAPGLVGAQREIQQGLVDHAEEKGWEVLTTTSNNDVQKQLDDINAYIAQQVDAIVAVPDDSAAICAAVEAASEAGIPFYTIDRAPLGCAINMTVLSDNALAGRQSGEELVRLLTERHGSAKGTVLEITGDLSQNVAQLRGSGFQEVIGQHPEITLITRTAEKWDSAQAADIVRDVASAEQLDAIYMHSDSAYTPGTLQVLREIDQLRPRGEDGHIFLAGVDGSVEALQAIRDGYADQSSNQPIPDFGIITDWIEQELNGEAIAEGEVVEEGALWSPGRIEMSEVGPQLLLATTNVTPEGVDDPRLWANVMMARDAETAATPEA